MNVTAWIVIVSAFPLNEWHHHDIQCQKKQKIKHIKESVSVHSTQKKGSANKNRVGFTYKRDSVSIGTVDYML